MYILYCDMFDLTKWYKIKIEIQLLEADGIPILFFEAILEALYEMEYPAVEM